MELTLFAHSCSKSALPLFSDFSQKTYTQKNLHGTCVKKLFYTPLPNLHKDYTVLYLLALYFHSPG